MKVPQLVSSINVPITCTQHYFKQFPIFLLRIHSPTTKDICESHSYTTNQTIYLQISLYQICYLFDLSFLLIDHYILLIANQHTNPNSFKKHTHTNPNHKFFYVARYIWISRSLFYVVTILQISFNIPYSLVKTKLTLILRLFFLFFLFSIPYTIFLATELY